MWVEVKKEEVFQKLENGQNLAIAIFPGAEYNKNVDMSDKVQVGKIYEDLYDENVKFFEEADEAQNEEEETD